MINLMITRISLLFSSLATFVPFFAAATVHEHAICESIVLDGAWEMAYRPYSYESVAYPAFVGKTVEKAVPGYWEDMVDLFRSAGIQDDFRINPQYRKQTFPIFNGAEDLTLPNIRGCFFYRRTVDLKRAGRALLAFEGVRNQVHAWVNGRFIAFRAGFSTPFELEIPAGVLKEGANELVLAVSNCPNPGYCDFVSGLTTRAVFRSTGGINGSMSLKFPKSDLCDVCVLTAKDGKSFEVRVSGDDAYSYEIADGERVIRKGSAKGSFSLPTAGYEFWTPENPKRYTLRIFANGGVYSQRFGLRRLNAAGERLLLNGKPVYLRGVTEHCYFPQTIHLPRDVEYYRMITRKRKELGFNFVRFHTFVPPVEYLDATDELGMLVEIETPNFVPVEEFVSIIAFARRHPSVVMYSTGNETRIDRIAEAYLEDVAGEVHAMTDSLFSPMSAMRGVEYALMPGKDVIVKKPFEHNQERVKRLSRYCDFFNAYQLGAFSYFSLNGAPACEVDRQGDAYCDKPRVAHEICIDSSYVDLTTEKLYPSDSPILKAGLFSGLREYFSRRGMLDKADIYFRNSCEWMRRIRKFTFEKVRSADRVAGYDFLGDINTHWHTFGYSVGMMDEFYRLKPGETVENVLRYNSAAVLLCDLGSDFNVEAGTVKKVGFSVSNFDRDAASQRLRAELADPITGEVLFRTATAFSGRTIPAGRVTELGSFEIKIPNVPSPRKYLLKAELSGGTFAARNEWEIYAFPRAPSSPASGNVRVVSDISKDALLAAMAAGERVLLFGAGPFKSLPTTFRIGMAGRTSGNFSTVVADHPALDGFPHEGYCSWQFRRLMEDAAAVQLEAGVKFDPIVDVASSVKCVIRQSMLFEYRVGSGSLMVCSFNFRSDDPAAVWLRQRLVDYAGSSAFSPRTAISPEMLLAVIDAPLLSGEANTNEARNPNDPSSNVRAWDKARP